MAAPAYVNHGTGVTTGTSVTVTKPSGTLDGHLMLVHIQHSTGNLGADGTAPSGWTLISPGRQENASSTHWYYWKIASSEPGSWDWTGYSSATLQYGIAVVSGADQTTPLNVTHLLQNTNIGGTTVALSVTSTVADCLLVGFAGQDQTVSTNTWSQASMTERYDESQTSDLTHCGYTETVTTATTYNRTITASVAQRISGALIAVAPASGTTFTQNLAGAVTPAGAQVRQTGKSTAGAVAPAGAPIRQANKALPGAVTPSGSLLKTTIGTFAGSVTPAGAVVNALLRLLSLAGAMNPAGALLKQANKVLSGSVTPAGVLTKQSQKLFAGANTPAGAVVNIKTILLSLVGAITPAGTLTRQTRRALGGTVAPAGALLKQVAKRYTGSVTPTSALAATRLAFLVVAGTIAPVGALAKRVAKTVVGTVNPTGVLLKLISRILGGSITPAGAGTHTIDIPQFNGTSSPVVTGLQSTAQITGVSAVATAAQRGTSTTTVSDG